MGGEGGGGPRGFRSKIYGDRHKNVKLVALDHWFFQDLVADMMEKHQSCQTTYYYCHNTVEIFLVF